MDPAFLEMKSTYGIIGLGVTGEVIIRYKVKKTSKSKSNLESFISAIKHTNVFKTKIDKNTRKLLFTFAADMPFYNRFLFSNILLFRPFVKKVIKQDNSDLSKLIKTVAYVGPVYENEENYYCDVSFQLSHHDSVESVIKVLKPYIKKHDVDYEIAIIHESSKQTSVKCPGYMLTKQTIKDNFKDLYITNHILTKSSLQFQSSQVSDCVIWFNPLYYPYDAIIDATNGKEHLLKKSLTMGIDFYKLLISKFSEENNVLQ